MMIHSILIDFEDRFWVFVTLLLIKIILLMSKAKQKELDNIKAEFEKK